MSSFKDFRIWMGWFASKHYGLILLLAFLILFCGIAGFMYFWGLRLLDMTDNPAIPSNPILGIVFVIGGIGFYFSVFAVGSGHFHASNNWRLAIEDALKFLKKYPVCKSKIENSIRHTKDAKDGSEMNERMENYERLLTLKKELPKLEDEQKKLPVQIEKKKEEIKELETKVGHY